MKRRALRAAREAALACVIGDLDLVRPLGLAGVRCAVVARPGARVRYSRFAAASIEWADPWSAPQVLLERLLSFGGAQPKPPVLFYEGDWDLLLVSRNRKRLAEVFRFVVPEAQLVEELVDKERFRSLALRLALPVPASAVLSHERPDELVGLEPPLVVKPLTRQLATWAGVGGPAKAVEVRTREELAAVRARLGEAGVDALAQELVRGPDVARCREALRRAGLPTHTFHLQPAPLVAAARGARYAARRAVGRQTGRSGA